MPARGPKLPAFRRRADFHSIYSYVISALVFGLFVFAILIFVFAGRISPGAGSVERYEAIRTAIEGQIATVKLRETELKGVTSEHLVGLRTSVDRINAMRALDQARTQLALLNAKRALAADQNY